MGHLKHKLKTVIHSEKGNFRYPCLHCSCGSTWSSSIRAMHYLVDQVNSLQSLLDKKDEEWREEKHKIGKELKKLVRDYDKDNNFIPTVERLDRIDFLANKLMEEK